MTAIEQNLLARAYAQAMYSGAYIIRHLGKLVTLPKADILIEKTKVLPNKQTMTLQQAIQKATASKAKAFINVDEKGICSLSSKFNKDATVYCYKNGNQIAVDGKEKTKTKTESQPIIMAEAKKGKPAKEAKATKTVSVANLTYNGKAVSIPAGKAKKWATFLKKPTAKGDGKTTIPGLTYNKKPVYLPEGRASKWKAVLAKFK